MDYKDSGVNIEAGNRAVEKIAGLAKKTFSPQVLTGLGGFGGLFALNPKDYQEPVLVSSTDGVGTKLLVAQALNRHDTVGIDLVAMSVNDVLCVGADPLFFLDYIACGKLVPEKIEQIVAGIAKGCQDAGCSLVGGETAEMPGMYSPDEYDLAGFAVGIVEKSRMITGDKIKAGDILIGLASSGLHSNGYSLARKVLLETAGLKPEAFIDSLGRKLGDELLSPTRIYAAILKKLKAQFSLLGIAHITGGAFYDKIIRIIPGGCGIAISRDSWPVSEIFQLIQEKGNVPVEDMYRTFNMGIGLVVVVPPDQKRKIIDFLDGIGEKAYIIGEVTREDRQVQFI